MSWRLCWMLRETICNIAIPQLMQPPITLNQPLILRHSLSRSIMVQTRIQRAHSQPSCSWLKKKTKRPLVRPSKGRVPNLRHMSRSRRVDLDWPFQRKKWTVLCPFNLCVPRSNWQTFFDQGAFATIQWKSLMRLFDIHPPSHFEC